MTNRIPEGFATITPSLVLDGAADALELYSKAFGGKIDYKMEMPDSKKIMHSCITIGTSKLFITDTMPTGGCMEPTASRFYLYFDDVDAAFKQATEAGLDNVMEPADMFWGDRVGAVKDKYGVVWSLATHVKDVSDADIVNGQKQWSKDTQAA